MMKMMGRNALTLCRLFYSSQPPSEGVTLTQYFCLENPMERGDLWAIVHRVAKSLARLKRLSVHACSNGIG